MQERECRYININIYIYIILYIHIDYQENERHVLTRYIRCIDGLNRRLRSRQ